MRTQSHRSKLSHMCQIMLTRVPTALTVKRKKIPTFKGIKSDSYHIQKFKMDQKSKCKHNYKTHKNTVESYMILDMEMVS